MFMKCRIYLLLYTPWLCFESLFFILAILGRLSDKMNTIFSCFVMISIVPLLDLYRVWEVTG